MESQLVLTLLDGMPWPAMIIDQTDHIVASNALAKTLFGSGIEGRHYILTLRQPGLLDAIETTLNSREPAQARHVITGPSRETTYRVQISPVAGEGQRGALCVFEEIGRAHV